MARPRGGLVIPAARQCAKAPCWVSLGRAAGGGGLTGRVVDLQALEKKGISHLEEKELKERNKRIQEDNRLELQKVGRPGPPSRGQEAFPRWAPGLGHPGLNQTGPDWLRGKVPGSLTDPGAQVVSPVSCFSPLWLCWPLGFTPRCSSQGRNGPSNPRLLSLQ